MAVYVMTFLRLVPAVLSVWCAIQREFAAAAVLLVVAVFLDGFLGMVKKRSQPLSQPVQLHIEGMTDLVAYGVCPGLFCLLLAPSWMMAIAVLIFVAAGIFRIARFNVEGLIAGYYRGLPITYNGYIVPVFYFLLRRVQAADLQAMALGGVLLIVSACMVSPHIKVKEIG